MKNKPATRIGIIGGGQLAKMLALSASQLGCTISVLEQKNTGVALDLSQNTIIGDWNNPDDLLKLAKHSDVITLENEFVNANSLMQLEQAGHQLFPTAATMQIVQDKLIQKQTLQDAGLPVPRFKAAESRQQINEIAKEFGWPLVIKARRNGYDGKGNITIHNNSETDMCWDKLNGDNQEIYVEEFCPFTAELATIITTGRDGATVSYPLVESIQKEHICHTIRAPALVSMELTEHAINIARHAVTTVKAIGSFGVEMFLMEGDKIIINELAPRVHNSGHYTIEACQCSQFENHIRAIMGWPLGSARMIKPAAIMINLLGKNNSSGTPSGLTKALAIPEAHIHIYGKEHSLLNRKMGHITTLGEMLSSIEQTAQTAAKIIQFGVQQ